jgi:selenocysteine-specific elongation factor
VVTKTDRAEAERVQEVELQTRSLVQAAGIEASAAFAVCALRGDGMEPLKAHLDALADAWQAPAPQGALRLAVDRSFILEGVGVVVTGMMAAGSVSIGDAVATCPGAVRARVRGLRVHDRTAQAANAGERCALNLAGAEVHPGIIARGDWIVAEDRAVDTRRFDAALRACAGHEAVRHGARVHVHLGAKEATARLLWLAEPGDASGREAWAQILLDEPIGALWGDRVLVRDWSASATLAGGWVVDPFADAGSGKRAERLAALEAQREPDAARALAGLVGLQTNGVDLERFTRSRNLARAQSDALFASVPMVQAQVQGRRLGFAPERWDALRQGILAEVDRHHQQNPDAWGPEEIALRKRFADAPGYRAVFGPLLQALIEEGTLARMGSRLHRPGRRPELSDKQRLLWQKIEPLLLEGGTRPPSIGPLSAAVGRKPTEITAFLADLAKRGYLLPVAPNRFFLPQAVLSLARAARDLAQKSEQGRFSAAEFRDLTGIGRNLSIEVLEYFDGCGLTRRVGEMRMVVKPPEKLFG